MTKAMCLRPSKTVPLGFVIDTSVSCNLDEFAVRFGGKRAAVDADVANAHFGSPRRPFRNGKKWCPRRAAVKMKTIRLELPARVTIAGFEFKERIKEVRRR